MSKSFEHIWPMLNVENDGLFSRQKRQTEFRPNIATSMQQEGG